MLLDVLGRTRITMTGATSHPIWDPASEGVGNLLNARRDWDCYLQLSSMNEECLVCAVHQTAPIMSLPFVHTARRCY